MMKKRDMPTTYNCYINKYTAKEYVQHTGKIVIIDCTEKLVIDRVPWLHVYAEEECTHWHCVFSQMEEWQQFICPIAQMNAGEKQEE